MALKLKYKDEHGILHINMSPSSSPTVAPNDTTSSEKTETENTELNDPKFDTINNRFGQYDLFGGKYEKYDEKQTVTNHDEKIDSSDEKRSLFRSRYNSIEEELANTPYAFATERTIRFNAQSPLLDITIARGTDVSPSQDIEDDRFFHRPLDSLFGPSIDLKSSEDEKDLLDTPAFTVTQLIHAQDRYFDLSSRTSTKSEVKSDRTVVRLREDRKKEEKDEAFKVLCAQTAVRAVQTGSAPAPAPAGRAILVVPTAKRKREKSFAILADRPSRPSSPRSLPVDINVRPGAGRVSPFRGRGFREETSRHTTPKTSAANSRAGTPPPRRRTSSLSRLDSMATLPPPLPPIQITQQHTPRDFVKENIEEVRELSELNREKHEAEAERKRVEEEEALLKEMGLLDQTAKSDAIRSVVCSRTTSRSNSPNKMTLRSRSNSPSAPSILRFENLLPENKIMINQNDGMAPVTHKSRVRSVSRSQPQSNDGSPKHSKIPKRQSSVSPNRKRTLENGLRKQNQRFISNSTSSIHETIRVGGQAHDRRGMSKSTQFLNISPGHVKGKPPIFPGRGGPPPSNRAINAKRLSPIVGTPNKSPTEDKSKPISARTPTRPHSLNRKPVKTAGNTPATSRFNSRQPSRNVSRDPSPEKKPASKSAASKFKPVARAVSTRVTSNNKAEAKKPVTRNSSLKTLTRTQMMLNKSELKKPVVSRQNSLKTLTRTQMMLNKSDSNKPPAPVSRQNSLKTLAKTSMILNKTESKKPPKPPVSRTASMKSLNKANDKVMLQKQDMSKSTNNLDEIKPDSSVQAPIVETIKESVSKPAEKSEKDNKKQTQSSTEESPSITKQDMETQYDKITNDKGELVIMTKKNIVSMTTAAITSQPLEVVTKVTNQLPAALEKAREKGMFERHSSKDSLAPKEDDKPKTTFAEDNVKLKPLLPPYNNPAVERAKQKIDDILKSPEVSTENIAATAAKAKEKEKSTFKNLADKTRSDIKDVKDDTTKKFTDLKEQAEKAATSAEKAVKETAENAEKSVEKAASDIRSEASKIVDSIMTPVEGPAPSLPKDEVKKNIEPTVVVVNEKTNGPKREAVIERMTETLVKGEPEVEVQSSNMSSPGVEKMAMQNTMADGSGSDKSAQSNGFPQSTSTTPKPPARTKKEAKDGSKKTDLKTAPSSDKPQNLCQRLMGKCKRCCACCGKGEKEMESEKPVEEKRGMMSRLNCCKKRDEGEMDAERGAGKASIEFESETKHKRSFRDVMCGWCGRRRRVSDAHAMPPHDVTAPGDSGCCGSRKGVERRDSILSDRPPASCCSRLSQWMRGCCRRAPPEVVASRRQSMFSKNKSLSPTLPPEDTRTKLDPSLVEHTSMIRGAIPVLPIALAYFCLFFNVVVPGLGTIFSGMFCLCFGIPRFGVHDGAKYRIGSFIINLLVGCGQLFTVLFCLVGWGWSIWWGVIMVKASRKYRKLKAEAAAQEAEEAPPVTANNHTRA